MNQVCVERLALDELRKPAARALLVRHRLAPLVASPGDHVGSDHAALEVVDELRRLGLDNAGIWPLMSQEDGYWPSERTTDRFAARIESLLAGGPAPAWLLVDLEPPLGEMRALRGPTSAAGLMIRNLSPRRYRRAHGHLRTLAGRLRERGVRTLACAAPFAGGDFRAGGRFWQDAWESPLAGVGWDAVGLMVYTTLLTSRSGGLLDESAACRFAYRAARATARRFGSGAAALVGLVGDGILGDEASYGDPEQLRLDVAAMHAAGVRHIVLYSLEGLLGTPHPERWLEALGTPTSNEPHSLRGDIAWRLVEGVGFITSWYRPHAAELPQRDSRRTDPRS